ncbi:putative membrane protein [Paenibacillus anaericanus]|nr:putative membrane protein [Paenibacillus anaericanus]
MITWSGAIIITLKLWCGWKKALKDIGTNSMVLLNTIRETRQMWRVSLFVILEGFLRGLGTGEYKEMRR